MSSLNYAEFDNIGTESDEDGQDEKPIKSSLTPQQAELFELDPSTNRYRFLHHGRCVYEWEQSLSEVILYIPAPPNGQKIACKIEPNRLRVGLVNFEPPFLEQETGGTVDVNESTWCIESQVVTIYLQKANKAVLWDCVLKGTTARMNPIQVEAVRKQLLLERYGDEHPGFNFEGASFNGSVPDARTYMGGVKYD